MASVIFSRRFLFRSNSGFCGRYDIRMSFPITTFPESASTLPAVIARSVDFPVPFAPTTPILSTLSIPILTLFSTGFDIYVLDILSRFKIFKTAYSLYHIIYRTF